MEFYAAQKSKIFILDFSQPNLIHMFLMLILKIDLKLLILPMASAQTSLISALLSR